MTTRHRIQKKNGRWHIMVTHTDKSLGPVGEYPIGAGWSSFELARQAYVNFADLQLRIRTTINNAKTNRRTDAVGTAD